MGTIRELGEAIKLCKDDIDDALDEKKVPRPQKFKDYGDAIRSVAFWDFDGTANSLVIPSTITHLRAHLLYGSPGVQTITIPSSVVSIDNDAFVDSNITEMTFTGRTRFQVKSMAGFGWGIQDSIRIHCDDGDMYGSGEEINPIPPTPGASIVIEGKKVILTEGLGEVPDERFLNDKNVYEVENRSNAITKIGSNAFNSCRMMIHFNSIDSELEGNLHEIGDGAFEECPILQDYELKNISKVGTRGFKGCKKLNTIDLSMCESIGTEAFFESGISGTYDCKHTTLIGDSAFKNCQAVQSLRFDIASKIGNESFSGCNHLTNIHLPNVIEIGERAFYGTTMLNSIDIPKATILSDYALEGCGVNSDMMSINLSKDIQNIPKGLLKNTGFSLKKLAIGKSESFNIDVDTIGSEAFLGCNVSGVKIRTRQFDVAAISHEVVSFALINQCTLIGAGYVTEAYLPNPIWSSQIIDEYEVLQEGKLSSDKKTFSTGKIQYAEPLFMIEGNSSIDLHLKSTSVIDVHGGKILVCSGTRIPYFRKIHLPYIRELASRSLAFIGCDELILDSVKYIRSNLFIGTYLVKFLNSFWFGKQSSYFGGVKKIIITNYVDYIEPNSLNGLKSIQLEKYTIDQIQMMDNYPWGLASGSIIKGSDGEITL